MERKVTYQSRIEKVVADAEQRKNSTFPIFEESNKEK